MHYKSCLGLLLTILNGGEDLGGLPQSLLFHTLCRVLKDFWVEKVVKSYKCILNETIIKLSEKEAAVGGKILSCIFMKYDDAEEAPFITTCPKVIGH